MRSFNTIRFNSTGSPNSLSKNVQFQVCRTAASRSHNTLGPGWGRGWAGGGGGRGYNGTHITVASFPNDKEVATSTLANNGVESSTLQAQPELGSSDP